MGWHVHHRGGRFRVYSTIVDAYITDWTTKEHIIELYIRKSKKYAQESAEANINRAYKYGCSAMKPFYCEEI